MASERGPRDVGKLVLWEEKQDWREHKGFILSMKTSINEIYYERDVMTFKY